MERVEASGAASIKMNEYYLIPTLSTSDRIFICLLVLFVASQLRKALVEIPHYFICFILAVTLFFLRFDLLWYDALAPLG